MKIIRNLKQKEILIIDNNDNVVSKLFFVPSFFLWVFYSDKPIIINKETDEIFYNNLSWIMNNNYKFSHEYSKKTENELIWLSEQCYDIEDSRQVDMTPRLIIKRVGEAFYISYIHPFFEKNNIHKNAIVTSFSPCGNGFYSISSNTNLTLQDDIINMFNSTLYKSIIEENKLKQRKLNKKST